MMDWKCIAISDGTEQQDRQSAALQPGYFDVDELSFENLLALGAEIAAQIRFHNLQNKIDGDWGDLLEADEAVIMAMILTIDLRRIEADFLRLQSLEPARLGGFLFELASRINHWHQYLVLSHHPSGEMLARKIAAIIDEKLADELNGLRGMVEERDFSEFGAVWCLAETPEKQPDASAKDNAKALSSAFYVFFNAISHIKQSTAMFLQQSLGSGLHNPAIGLFIVFVQLYQRAQKQLNRFTLRHRDFYYRQMLKADNRPEQAESYYLVLETQARSDRVDIEQYSEFSAGKDAGRNPIIYRADEALLARDTQVAALATLYLQHDRLISPEAEVGFVTRIKSARPEPGAVDAEQSLPWPLFGTEQQIPNADVKQNATRIGFCIASELLLLEQGQRKIDIAIELAPLQAITLDEQLSELTQSRSTQEFNTCFGRLFTRYLLSFSGCLNKPQKEQIISAAGRLSKDLGEEISNLLCQDWQGLFYKLLRKIFRIRLTAESGWLEVADYILLPYEEDPNSQTIGLRIQFSLGQEVEPIIPHDATLHGAEQQSELPLMQCLLNPQSHFCPYSLFQDLIIDSLQVNVDVRGVKNILAYNQHGQLDPSKPFQPFGPLPNVNSYFVFGNYPMARKPLQALTIHLDWADLPRDAGGFDEYYHGYTTRFGNRSFKGRLNVLSDSRWQPQDSAAQSFALFDSTVGGSHLLSAKTVEVSQLEDFKAIDAGIPEAGYHYDLKARNGFIRLSLAAPEQAFGHAEYPPLLSSVLSANARRRKPQATPNPPYTPTLNSLSLDYRASVTIKPAARAEERSKSAQQIWLLHPFGIETVYPVRTDRPCYLLPQYAHEGNLFIGLRATDPSSVLTLLFNLSQERSQQGIQASSNFDWFYLTSNHWKKLPRDYVLSDSTHGFLSSGIVRLKIPQDINRANSVMPGEYFWLRVSVEQAAQAFAACNSIRTNAIKVTRQVKAGMESPVPASINWSPLRSLPGISGVKQAYGPIGGRSKENDAQCVTRLGERLRHKNRALLPSDYEHLILERFPQVYKVKCFNSISSVEDAIKPGQVLIVVVPFASGDGAGTCAPAMFDTKKLEQIRAYVQSRCSPCAQLEIRNPNYEQVQVRCSVRFTDAVSEGVNIARLNQYISDYICPWKKTGYKARFGWRIHQHDLESSIRSLSYVDFVTDFSMLHITVDRDGNYSLFDTAQRGQNHQAVIRPRYPWSLAVPEPQHYIQPLQMAKPIRAEVTGVDELAVGSTFIISGSNGHGEEE